MYLTLPTLALYVTPSILTKCCSQPIAASIVIDIIFESCIEWVEFLIETTNRSNSINENIDFLNITLSMDFSIDLVKKHPKLKFSPIYPFVLDLNPLQLYL